MALGDAGATVRTAAAIGPEIDVDLLASVQRAPTVGVLDDLERAATGRTCSSSPRRAFASDTS